MIVRQHSASPALTPFVRGFELVETQEAVTRTLLPDISVIVGFRYAGFAVQLNGERPRRMPHAAVVGLRSSTREMHTSANSGIVLARFRAAGAATFFRQPLHRFFGLTCPLVQLFDEHDVATASSRVVKAVSDAERMAIVEAFLLAQQRPLEPDPIVGAALRAIGTAAGVIRVSAIARDLRIDQGTLERRFRRHVGASPKQFASIVRLRHAVDLSREGSSLTNLALDAGYYDQSHFIRDFRAVTGAAPGDFFQNTEYC